MKGLTVTYLQNKFNIYNKRFFNGQLPAIKIVLSRTKTALGQFCWSCNNENPDEIFDLYIKISTYYDLPAKEIQDTLIHEMIHYYIHYNNIKDTGTHGKYFMQKANEINEKSTYHISACAYLKNPKLNNADKTYRIIRFVNNAGKICYGRISKNFDYKYFIERYKMTEVTIFETRNTKFDDWKESRKILRYYYGSTNISNIVSKTDKKVIYKA